MATVFAHIADVGELDIEYDTAQGEPHRDSLGAPLEPREFEIYVRTVYHRDLGRDLDSDEIAELIDELVPIIMSDCQF